MLTITSTSAFGCFSWQVFTISIRPSTICDALCSWLLVPARTTITYDTQHIYIIKEFHQKLPIIVVIVPLEDTVTAISVN